MSFTAIGPAGMKITGQTSELAVKDDAQEVAIAVPLAGLKTAVTGNVHVNVKGYGIETRATWA